ncbi:hypothetical protein [Falsiroseomonas sp.]|uniref:hypothetical protein n=1 Tax=Falsiroseomonas sp. TaxID=2870721 RepID=UPI0034A133C2
MAKRITPQLAHDGVSLGEGGALATLTYSPGIEKSIGDVAVLSQLCETLLKHKQFKSAAAVAAHGRELEPNSFSFRVLDARAITALGDASAAVNAWRRVLELRPRHLESCMKIAHAFARLGSFVDTRRYLDEANAISPGHPETIPALTLLALGTGDAEQALAAYRLRVLHRGTPPAASLEFACLLLKAGAAEEARTMLGKRPDMGDERLRWASLRVEIALKLGEWSDVAKLTQEAVRGAAPRAARARLWASLRALDASPGRSAAALNILGPMLGSDAPLLARAARRRNLPHLAAALQALGVPERPRSGFDDTLSWVDLLLRRDFATEAAVLAPPAAGAVDAEPKVLDAMAHAQAAMGDWRAAIATRERLSVLSPDDMTNLALLAAAQSRAGMTLAAERTLLRCLSAKAAKPEILCELGVLAARTGRWARARALLAQASRIAPGDGEALYQSGLVCESLGLEADAIEAYSRCLAARPDHLRAWSRLAELEGLGPASEASGHLAMQAARPEPSVSERRFVVEAWMEAGDNARARSALVAGLQAVPGNPLLLRLKAILELVSGNAADAVEAIESASAIEPKNPRLLDDKLILLCAKGDFSDARKHAARHATHFAAQSQQGRGVGLLTPMLLGVGQFREAFAMYRRSTTSAALRASLGPARFASDLASLAQGERLLVLPAWGIGDEVNWCAIYPQIAARHPATVFGADPRLLPLFRRSFPDLTFTPVARWHGRRGFPPVAAAPAYAGLPDLALACVMDGPTWHLAQRFDRVAVATDLLAEFRGSRAAFPQRAAYLRPDQTAVDAWRQSLAELCPGRRIGIAWTSSVDSLLRRVHTTRLEDWRAAFDVRGVNFVSLQVDGEAQLAARPDVPVHCLPGLDLRNNIDGTAALIAALDSVVSIVSSTGELAGALGAPTLLLNRSRTLDWRVANAQGADLVHPTAAHIGLHALAARLDSEASSGAGQRRVDKPSSNAHSLRRSA